VQVYLIGQIATGASGRLHEIELTEDMHLWRKSPLEKTLQAIERAASDPVEREKVLERPHPQRCISLAKLERVLAGGYMTWCWRCWPFSCASFPREDAADHRPGGFEVGGQEMAIERPRAQQW